MIKVGASDSVRAWVVYPERSTKAPVVIVVHEIFGLSTWVRAMADQVAADGFIAIAPDLLTGKGVEMAGDTVVSASASTVIRTLDAGEVQRRLSAVAEYGMSLPAATRRYGITGFCWGGGTTFAHAAAAPGLGAGVAFYGPLSPPVRAQLATSAKAPVLGLYAADDARVNATIPAADSAFQQAGVRFEKEIYAGAGHGFVRQQDGREGANLEATRRAWPRAVAWFRQHLEQGG
jgi:carboxymethylenebutenolidase